MVAQSAFLSVPGLHRAALSARHGHNALQHFLYVTVALRRCAAGCCISANAVSGRGRVSLNLKYKEYLCVFQNRIDSVLSGSCGLLRRKPRLRFLMKSISYQLRLDRLRSRPTANSPCLPDCAAGLAALAAARRSLAESARFPCLDWRSVRGAQGNLSALGYRYKEAGVLPRRL